MFEQRRCQRAATPQEKVRAVLRLDAPDAVDDVRSKALERAPFKTFRPVGRDILPDIVRCDGQGADRSSRHAQQRFHPGQRRYDSARSSRRRGNRRHRRKLDHAVHRDVFKDFEFSHSSLGIKFVNITHREVLMKRVTGIGGIFFKAKDAPALQAWYKRHLGIDGFGLQLRQGIQDPRLCGPEKRIWPC
jgi:hypothetical protein